MVLCKWTNKVLGFVKFIKSFLSVTGSIARVGAFYGRGDGPILLDNLFCNGRETNLFHCPFVVNPTGKSHAEDAGVQCFPRGNERI